MGTNFNILGKGLKQLGLLVFLLIASPILLSMAFKAIRIFKDGIQYAFSIPFLIVSGLLILFTIFYAFRTFRTILSSLFQEK